MSFQTYEESYAVIPDEHDEPIKYSIGLDSHENFQQLLENYKIVVVDVWATFCSPCHHIGPLFENLAKSYKEFTEKNEIVFTKDCIDDDYYESIHYGNVKAVPTFFIYLNGKVVASIIGGDFEKLKFVLSYILQHDYDGENRFSLHERKKSFESKLEKLYENGTLEKNNKLFSDINSSNIGVC